MFNADNKLLFEIRNFTLRNTVPEEALKVALSLALTFNSKIPDLAHLLAALANSKERDSTPVHVLLNYIGHTQLPSYMPELSRVQATLKVLDIFINEYKKKQEFVIANAIHPFIGSINQIRLSHMESLSDANFQQAKQNLNIIRMLAYIMKGLDDPLTESLFLRQFPGMNSQYIEEHFYELSDILPLLFAAPKLVTTLGCSGMGTFYSHVQDIFTLQATSENTVNLFESHGTAFKEFKELSAQFDLAKLMVVNFDGHHDLANVNDSTQVLSKANVWRHVLQDLGLGSYVCIGCKMENFLHNMSPIQLSENMDYEILFGETLIDKEKNLREEEYRVQIRNLLAERKGKGITNLVVSVDPDLLKAEERITTVEYSLYSFIASLGHIKLDLSNSIIGNLIQRLSSNYQGDMLKEVLKNYVKALKSAGSNNSGIHEEVYNLLVKFFDKNYTSEFVAVYNHNDFSKNQLFTMMRILYEECENVGITPYVALKNGSLYRGAIYETLLNSPDLDGNTSTLVHQLTKLMIYHKLD